MKRCDDCVFCYRFIDESCDVPALRCHRNAPAIGPWANRWPSVKADEWCGEFKERKSMEDGPIYTHLT